MSKIPSHIDGTDNTCCKLPTIQRTLECLNRMKHSAGPVKHLITGCFRTLLVLLKVCFLVTGPNSSFSLALAPSVHSAPHSASSPAPGTASSLGCGMPTAWSSIHLHLSHVHELQTTTAFSSKYLQPPSAPGASQRFHLPSVVGNCIKTSEPKASEPPHPEPPLSFAFIVRSKDRWLVRRAEAVCARALASAVGASSSVCPRGWGPAGTRTEVLQSRPPDSVASHFRVDLPLGSWMHHASVEGLRPILALHLLIHGDRPCLLASKLDEISFEQKTQLPLTP